MPGSGGSSRKENDMNEKENDMNEGKHQMTEKPNADRKSVV